jgi:hypothetical protein
VTADRKKPARLGLASAMLLAVGLADIYSALQAKPQSRKRLSTREYSDRTGFPRAAAEMRGAALAWKRKKAKQVHAAE